MSRSAPESGTEENERVRRDLVARLRERFEAEADRPVFLAAHGWDILDYSSCLSIEWMRGQARWGVFVKIPKTGIDQKTVLPACEADRVLARDEFASLNYLQRYWNGSEAGVEYVKPLGFFEDCNAIVTERTYSGDLLGPFRRAALSSRTTGAAGNPLEGILRRIGVALGRFHRRSQAAEAMPAERFEAAQVIGKIDGIVEHLRTVGAIPPHAADLEDMRASWATYCTTAQPTMTLKGLDVRNMLVDDQGSVKLLDPGRLKKDVAEADVARLLVTVQILFWGTPWFFLRVQPAARYERALLEGYGSGRLDEAPLRLLVVKELFKHWRAAYVALSRKRWPRPLEWSLGRVYVDAFYRAATQRAIARLRIALPRRPSAAHA